MRFYNVVGQPFDLTPDTWFTLREVARSAGWLPSGTQRPPMPPELLGGDFRAFWKGGYDSEGGQEVTRSDAQGMARALEEALQRRLPDGVPPSEVQRMAAFCRQGGFVICAPANAQPDEPGVEETIFRRSLWNLVHRVDSLIAAPKPGPMPVRASEAVEVRPNDRPTSGAA
jgi:hypothetical protein